MGTIKDELYQIYANSLVKELTSENLKKLITLFISHAALNLGCTADKANVDRVIDIIQEDYSMMPISQVFSAFARGSMGKLGETRLIPKNINSWLHDVQQEYLRFKEAKERVWVSKEIKFDLNNHPVGRAIIKKIEWIRAGIMHIDDWDNVDIFELSEKLRENKDLTYENYLNACDNL